MRNKHISVLASLFVVIMTFGSCDKGKGVIKHDTYSEFATPILVNDYFVLDVPGTQYKIPIGLTNVATSDTKITIKDSSRTAVNGTQYTLENSTITIPAGKASDSVVLKGIYAGYPPGRIDSVYLKITGGDAPLNSYATTYLLRIQGYCDVNIDDFEGDYHNARDVYNGSSAYGPYDMDLTVDSKTATSADVTVGNLYDYGVSGITTKVHLDWSKPGGFIATIPDQVMYAPDNVWIKADGDGTFSSCNGSLTLRFQLYDKGTNEVLVRTVTTMKR